MSGNGYVELAKKFYQYSTDASQTYAEATALSILGFALGRETIHLIQPKAVYHNSYTLLVGKSTKSRKTTVAELGQDILDVQYWLPNESTPEKLLVNLSKKPQGYCWLGEISKILKGIKGSNYMSTIAETLNDMFNCPAHYVRDLMKETYTIENAYLNVHSTITPEVLKENITGEMFHGGLLPRWLIVSSIPTPKPRGRLIPDVLELNKILMGYTNAIMEMEKDVMFELDDEALAYFNKIEEDVIYHKDYECVGAFAGRYENYIIAFADLYLISDVIGNFFDGKTNESINEVSKLSYLVRLVGLEQLSTRSITNPNNLPNLPNQLTNKTIIQVSKPFVERAFNFVKPCLDYVRELATYIDMDKPLARVRDYLQTYRHVTRINLIRDTNLTARILDEAIDTLTERHEIKMDTSTGRRVYDWIEN